MRLHITYVVERINGARMSDPTTQTFSNMTLDRGMPKTVDDMGRLRFDLVEYLADEEKTLVRVHIINMWELAESPIPIT